MPKLPTLTPRHIIKLLEERGFILDRVKDSHHIYYHPDTGRRTVVPLHKQDLRALCCQFSNKQGLIVTS